MLSAEIASYGDTVTVVLYGELDVAVVPALARQLAQLLQPWPKRLIFELSGLVFTDCAGARLIAGVGMTERRLQRPVVRNARPGVRRVFELTGLDALCQLDLDEP